LRLRTGLLVGATSLFATVCMTSVAPPAANAAPTQMGSCTNAEWLLRATNPLGGGLGDQTGPIRIAGGLARNRLTHAAITGNCSGATDPADKHMPELGTLSTLTPKTASISLSGSTSCAVGGGTSVDGSAALAYPVHGKITWIFFQTYNDLVSGFPKPYKMQADIAVLGLNADNGNNLTNDVYDVSGIVLSGVNAGGVVGGAVWQDPAVKVSGGFSSWHDTGYTVDLQNSLNCADGSAGNANIRAELIGGGGLDQSPLGQVLGSGGNAAGLLFTAGE
jgi:hypothetical protein